MTRKTHHLVIGLPLIIGTLVGTAVLARAREHLYTAPQLRATEAKDAHLKKARSKEELVEELMRRAKPVDDYEMKPVI